MYTQCSFYSILSFFVFLRVYSNDSFFLVERRLSVQNETIIWITPQ